MSFSTGIRNLEARIRRAEAAARKGRQYCARCRLMERRPWPDARRPEPDETITAKCEFCRSEYPQSLTGLSAEGREVIKLYYCFTLEDRYRNPQAHALALWLRFCPRLQPRLEKTREQFAKAMAKGGQDPQARAFAKLLTEARDLLAQKHQRLRARYGETPFPEQMLLIETVRNRARHQRNPGVEAEGLVGLEQEEAGHLICAEMEKIIWGSVRSETVTALERTRREIEELITTAEEAP